MIDHSVPPAAALWKQRERRGESHELTKEEYEFTKLEMLCTRLHKTLAFEMLICEFVADLCLGSVCFYNFISSISNVGECFAFFVAGGFSTS